MTTSRQSKNADHYDNVTLARSILEQCAALFHAISKESKDLSLESPELQQVHKLAGIGECLADDWYSQFNSIAKEFDSAMNEGAK